MTSTDQKHTPCWNRLSYDDTLPDGAFREYIKSEKICIGIGKRADLLDITLCVGRVELKNNKWQFVSEHGVHKPDFEILC